MVLSILKYKINASLNFDLSKKWVSSSYLDQTSLHCKSYSVVMARNQDFRKAILVVSSIWFQQLRRWVSAKLEGIRIKDTWYISPYITESDFVNFSFSIVYKMSLSSFRRIQEITSNFRSSSLTPDQSRWWQTHLIIMFNFRYIVCWCSSSLD